MIHPRLIVSAAVAIMLLGLAACGGDDPPPADIHPLTTKPFASSASMVHHDDSESVRILALVTTYAQKHYKTDLDYTRHDVSDQEAERKKHWSGDPPPIEDRPLWRVAFPVSKVKKADIMEMSNRDSSFPVSARVFFVYIKDRIVEQEPLRIPAFATH